MAARQEGGQYLQQDGMVLVRHAPGRGQSHPQWRWEQRVNREWADESVRAIWRVSEPVRYMRADDGGAARYHEPTDMVLIAHYGILDTVVDLTQDPEHIQQSVRDQVAAAGERDGDE